MLCIIICFSACNNDNDDDDDDNDIIVDGNDDDDDDIIDDDDDDTIDKCIPCQFWYDCEIIPVYGEDNICIDGCCEWFNYEDDLEEI